MLFSVLNFRKIQNFQKIISCYCKTCTIMLAIEFNLFRWQRRWSKFYIQMSIFIVHMENLSPSNLLKAPSFSIKMMEINSKWRRFQWEILIILQILRSCFNSKYGKVCQHGNADWKNKRNILWSSSSKFCRLAWGWKQLWAFC